MTITDDLNWVSLVDVMGNPEWACESDFEESNGRIASADLIEAHISEWTKNQEGKELEGKLLEAGIPAGVVARSSDLLSDPQYDHLGFYKWHDHGAMGRVPYAGHQYSIDNYDHGRALLRRCSGNIPLTCWQNSSV